jgi:hypothetical protein
VISYTIPNKVLGKEKRASSRTVCNAVQKTAEKL